MNRGLFRRVLLVVVGMIVVGGGVAYLLTGEMLRREARLRLHPVGGVLSSRVEASLAAPDTRSGIVLVGDSRAAQWTPQWKSPVCNLGVPGATTVELRHGFEHLPAGGWDGRPVLIQAGINDLKTLAYSGEDRGRRTDQTLRNLLTLRSGLVARGAGPVVIIGILPGGPVPLWRRPFWSDTIDEARLDVNRQLAEALPPDAWVAPPSDLEPADFVDHLHFSPSGYRKVERALREAGFPPGEDGSR